MRVCRLLVSKKVKKVRDNSLTLKGWGALDVYGAFEVMRSM